MAVMNASAVITVEMKGGGKRTYHFVVDGSKDEILEKVEKYAHRQARMFRDQERLLRWTIRMNSKYTDVGYVPLPAEPFGEEK
jgi:hypothetical protein